jgi:ABC-type multidrug transport system ATPase subunit
VREVAETYARVLGVEPEWGLFGVDYLNKRVGELSSGMAKRVVLAIALSAKLLLALDEPTAFLNERWRRRLVELLRERAPAAVATHDPELIFSLPDWDAVVLEEGRAKYVGKAEGLRELAAYRCGERPAEAPWGGERAAMYSARRGKPSDFLLMEASRRWRTGLAFLNPPPAASSRRRLKKLCAY